MRTNDQRDELGNRVAAWIVSLPVGEKDPARRLRALCASTAELKRADHTAGTELLASLSEWAGQSILSAAIRLAFLARPFNIVITNVPGPQVPLYLLDSPMQAVFPQVPRSPIRISASLFSYRKLYWGFNADRDQVPDVDLFVDAVAGAPSPSYAVQPRPVRRRSDGNTCLANHLALQCTLVAAPLAAATGAAYQPRAALRDPDRNLKPQMTQRGLAPATQRRARDLPLPTG